MTAVKICGLTRPEDADAAVECGADALGFVLWPSSPRHTTIAAVRDMVRRLPPFVTPVAVLVDPSGDDLDRAAEAGIRLAQIHGAVPVRSSGRPRLPVLRAVHLSASGDAAIEPAVADDTVLLDAYDPVQHGGTGKTVDWARARVIAAARRIVLAGGLTPGNVADAIRTVRPYAVDVASGVEREPGIKDHAKLRAFIEAARGTVS